MKTYQVIKVESHSNGIFGVHVIIPEFGTDTVIYNVKKDLEWDNAPVYQQLAGRLIAGEFEDIIVPLPQNQPA